MISAQAEREKQLSENKRIMAPHAPDQNGLVLELRLK